jgi:predicted transcriptional regulator
MAETKRTPEQREEDLVVITRMYLQGKRQYEIAEVIGVTREQISYDLKEIRTRWRESTLVDFNEMKQRELEKIDLLEETYWAAWQRSIQEKTKTRTSKTGDTNSASIEKETLLGDPRFLQGVERCVDMRAKILGTYAPVKMDSSVSVEITSAELIKAMREGLTEMAEKGAF